MKEVSPKLPGSSGPVSPGGTKVDDNWSGNAGQTGGLGQTGSPGQSGNQTPSGGQEPALSTGAIVAIAVCTSIVGLAIIALIFWVLWRRRRSARHAASQPTPLSPENLGHFNDKTDDYVAHMRRISDENPNRPEHSAVGGHDPSVVGYNPSAAGHTTVTNTTWRPQGT